MQHIGKALKKFIQTSGLEKVLDQQNLIDAWDVVVGEKVCKNAIICTRASKILPAHKPVPYCTLYTCITTTSLFHIISIIIINNIYILF